MKIEMHLKTCEMRLSTIYFVSSDVETTELLLTALILSDRC